jgi:hypothetical protein
MACSDYSRCRLYKMVLGYQTGVRALHRGVLLEVHFRYLTECQNLLTKSLFNARPLLFILICMPCTFKHTVDS